MKNIYFILFFVPIMLIGAVPEVPEFDFEKIINYDIFSERRSVSEVGFYDLGSYYILVPNISIPLPTQKNPFNSSYFIMPTLLGKDGSVIKTAETRTTGTYFDFLADTIHQLSYVLADENQIRIICKRGFRVNWNSVGFFTHPVIFDFNYNLELQKVKTDTTFFHPYMGSYLVIRNDRYFYGYNKLKFLLDSNGYELKGWGAYYIKEYKETENYLEDMHKDIELKFPTDMVDTLMSEFIFRIKNYPDEDQISAYFIFKDTSGKLIEKLCHFDSEGNFLFCNEEKLPRAFVSGSIFDKNDNAYTFNRNTDKGDSIPPTLIKYDKNGNVVWETDIPQDLNEKDSLKVYIYRGNINAKFLDSNHIVVYYSKYYYDLKKTKVYFPFFYIYDTDGNLLKTYEWDRTIEGDARWWYIQDIYKEDENHLFVIGRPTSNLLIDGRIIISRIRFSTTDVKDDIKNEISKIEVYPNPADDEININIANNIYNYKIIDALGKVIQTGETQGRIEVNNLLPGFYNLKIFDNNKTFHTKFIKN